MLLSIRYRYHLLAVESGPALIIIYNHYYNTTIDIRSEIAEIGNVTWVRAFKFIFHYIKPF